MPSDSPRHNLRSPPILLATWFGSGLLPKIPGTWGSLAALPFAWVIAVWGGNLALLAAAVIVFVIGIWASNRYISEIGGEDPGPVVIDEVAGQWLTLCVITPDPLFYGLGFVLFRITDILKPWPANWADREVKGGLGVMLDDVLAAAYSAAMLVGVKYWMTGTI